MPQPSPAGATGAASVAEQLRRLAGLLPPSGPAVLAVLFFSLGLFAMASLSLQMPPFHNPDEATQFMRAYQVSRLVPIGYRLGPENAGGLIDNGIVQALQPVLWAAAAGEAAVTPAMRRDAAAASWTGSEAEAGFPNTARYPPLFYLPAAAAIGIGRLADLTVFSTLHLARALTGVAAALIGTAAIAVAGAAAPWLFTLLCLPGSLAQMASPSQDGLMIPLAALAAALLGTALREGVALSRLAFWGLVAVLAVVAQARPPYAAMALLLLLPPRPGWRQRLTGLAVVVAATLAWAGYAAVQAQVIFHGILPPGAVIDPGAQLALLRDEPWRLPALLGNTARICGWNVWNGVAGQLGWLDILFSRAYYRAADSVMLLAALLCLRGRWPAPRRIGAPVLRLLAGAAAIGLSLLGILAVQYLTYTVVGGDYVEGLEGRYLLPLLMFLAALLPLGWPAGRWPGLWTALFAVVAVFPLVSQVATLHAIARRFFW